MSDLKELQKVYDIAKTTEEKARQNFSGIERHEEVKKKIIVDIPMNSDDFDEKLRKKMRKGMTNESTIKEIAFKNLNEEKVEDIAEYIYQTMKVGEICMIKGRDRGYKVIDLIGGIIARERGKLKERSYKVGDGVGYVGSRQVNMRTYRYEETDGGMRIWRAQ